MERIAVIAITKNGVKMAKELKEKFPSWKVFAPDKFSDHNKKINWYTDSTTTKIMELFKSNDALVCLFSLGAVVRLISPHLKDKKTDPAVIVIDDQAQFVISTLSGHLGGANQLTNDIAEQLGATPVITTAADVNKTIAVDLVGKDLGWKIDDDTNVTKVSAFMVNAEKIAVYQNCGSKNWWQSKLPENVSTYTSIDELKKSQSKGYLIISDELISDNEILENAVVYRPRSLVVGVGLHWDTSKDKIMHGLDESLKKFNLSKKSIARFVSIKKEKDVVGLNELAEEMNIPLELFDRVDLATIITPNPSKMVEGYEGTASVSEAAAIKSSGGILIVEKTKISARPDNSYSEDSIMKRGLLLIDRGSREKEAKQELEVICKKIKEKGNYKFCNYCFLEVIPPFIEEGINQSIAHDIDELTIVPYFLYPGKKIKAAVNESIRFQEKTGVKLRITKPMSMHKTMIELVHNRVTSALSENSVSMSTDTVDVLIIGHGSKDPNAKRSMEYVVEGIGPTYRNVSSCFLEIEEPNIEQGIMKCKNDNPEVLVIVFYFLHEGAHVKRDIYEDLNPALEKANLSKVLITKHIGTDKKMIDLVLKRAKEVENAN